MDISFPEIEKFDALPAPRADGPTAFVSIMEGCSKTFSCAFSRIEQVLMRMTSASASTSVSSSPCSAASTSAMRAESYTFIWQPWVLM